MCIAVSQIKTPTAKKLWKEQKQFQLSDIPRTETQAVKNKV